MRRSSFPAAAGIFILLLIVLVGIFAPQLAPHDPNGINMTLTLASPSAEYPLGTDYLGRCTLSRILHGSRISLFMAFAVNIICLAVSVPYGLISGGIGGRTDHVMMRIVEIFMAFPGIILAMAIAGTLGPSLKNTIIAMTAVSWAGSARFIRSLVIQIKDRDYITASYACGTSRFKILVRHILPNIAGQIVVMATIDMGYIILAMSGMSFLGLGVQPPTAEWGAMLSDCRPYFSVKWELMLYPGLAIVATVLAFNLIGESLRDMWDPDTRKESFLRRKLFARKRTAEGS